MRHLMDTAVHEEKLSIGNIMQMFGLRGFAFLMLILSLLNLVIFMIPFSSALFGLPMVILSVQMIMGLHAPVFPHFIRRQTIGRNALVSGLERALPWVEKLERYIKPRLAFLTSPRLERMHGLVALILAVMVTLPLPLFNVPPSIAIFSLAIGMLQRDGLFIILAYAIGFWCLVLFKSLSNLAFH